MSTRAVHERIIKEQGIYSRRAKKNMTATQTAILHTLTAATTPTYVVYRTEWSGYLPNPLTHWAEVNGTEISTTFPQGWRQDDIEVLVEGRYLSKASEWRNPEDTYEHEITYMLDHERS